MTRYRVFCASPHAAPIHRDPIVRLERAEHVAREHLRLAHSPGSRVQILEWGVRGYVPRLEVRA
jgi:hypothetical protein